MFYREETSGLPDDIEHVLVTPMGLANVDIFDPHLYVKGVPHEAFRVLRAEAPVHFHPEPGGPGFWAITKYADLVTCSKDPGTYSSWKGGTNIPDYPRESLEIIRMLMLNMDPPMHTKFRRL